MFVTFEGLDGSGKTTQAELLRARLGADGEDVVATREPGGTELGDSIRDLVLHGGHVVPWAEALLYAASRAQLVEQVIRPALRGGSIVLCDRYVDSSAAYQGGARGLGVQQVLDVNLVAVDGLLPELTFLLDITPKEAIARVGESRDRIEREDSDFHRRVRSAYAELARRFPDRIVMLDGSRPVEELAEEVYVDVRGGS